MQRVIKLKVKLDNGLKKLKKEENLCKGKEIFEKELKKQGVIYSEISKGEVYERIIKRNNIHSMDDLYSTIGVGLLSASTYISKLKKII